MKSRLLVGILIFTPFALTVGILWFVIVALMGIVTKPVTLIAVSLGAGKYTQYLITGASLILILLLIYSLGLLSTTILGRRFIAAGERALRRIPGGEFLYNTIKEIIDLVSLVRSSPRGQRIVMIEFPRKGVFSVAFYSGLTLRADTGETLVNVFYATTPNPTTGFLMLLQPSEVWETNLSFADATRLVMSGGVVGPRDLKLRPFPIEEYLAERQKAKDETGQNNP